MCVCVVGGGGGEQWLAHLGADMITSILKLDLQSNRFYPPKVKGGRGKAIEKF